MASRFVPEIKKSVNKIGIAFRKASREEDQETMIEIIAIPLTREERLKVFRGIQNIVTVETLVQHWPYSQKSLKNVFTADLIFQIRENLPTIRYLLDKKYVALTEEHMQLAYKMTRVARWGQTTAYDYLPRYYDNDLLEAVPDLLKGFSDQELSLFAEALLHPYTFVKGEIVPIDSTRRVMIFNSQKNFDSLETKQKKIFGQKSIDSLISHFSNLTSMVTGDFSLVAVVARITWEEIRSTLYNFIQEYDAFCLAKGFPIHELTGLDLDVFDRDLSFR